jgi:hypothetical protein
MAKIDELAEQGLCCYLVTRVKKRNPTYEYCSHPSTVEDPFLCAHHRPMVDFPQRVEFDAEHSKSKERAASRNYYWRKKAERNASECRIPG